MDNNAEVQQAVNEAMAEQKKKKRKKSLIIIGVILLVIIIGIALASSGGNDDKGTTKSQINASDSTNTNSEVDAENDTNAEGKIGDFVCVVKNAKVCKNWEGKDAVKITYSFTNNSKESESFDIALSDEVYQDGIQLESSFIDDDDDWGIDVKIKPGMTKEVSKVYLLRDKKTDLEVEVSELISFSDDKLVTTVKLEK